MIKFSLFNNNMKALSCQVLPTMSGQASDQITNKKITDEKNN